MSFVRTPPRETPHRNYEKFEDTLGAGEEKVYPYSGDFFDIVYVSTALSDLSIKFFLKTIEQPYFKASEILPTNTPFTKVGIRNDSASDVSFTAIVGREFFRTAKQGVTIVNELIGLIDRLDALIDDTIKGVLRSIGDAGDSPVNTAGETALKRLSTIQIYMGNLRDSLSPRSVYNSSTASALSVSIDLSSYTKGRSYIEVWVKSSAAADFNVYGSTDNASWRLIDTLSLSATGELHQGYFNAYPYIQVSTDAANDNEIEIVASR